MLEKVWIVITEEDEKTEEQAKRLKKRLQSEGLEAGMGAFLFGFTEAAACRRRIIPDGLSGGGRASGGRKLPDSSVSDGEKAGNFP